MTYADRVRELVVLSHLRWDWVWQRPQHLISRLARDLPCTFVEEPVARPGCRRPRLRHGHGDVERTWLEVPGPERWVGFGDEAARHYRDHLAELLPPRDGRVVWLYTALALDLVDALEPDLVVYDVMDDLASFKGAVPEQRLRHHAALRRADVVFTGGRTLHAGVTRLRTWSAHCFPSGVEPEHYSPAIARRAERRGRRGARPVAGYVGVIDERLDLELVAGLAAALPGWDVQMVGPVAKIDPASLPQAPNLHWTGPRRYEELPEVMGGFDVALMPFALNESTHAISPTKTLEYLAAGLPVVSTRVPDVVADHAAVVALADDADGFARACRDALDVDPAHHHERVRPTLEHHHWDSIAARMRSIIQAAALRNDALTGTTT